MSGCISVFPFLFMTFLQHKKKPVCGRMNFLVLAVLDIGNEVVVLAEKRGQFLLSEMKLTPESLELPRENDISSHEAPVA
jgi:hypothetical protein